MNMLCDSISPGRPVVLFLQGPLTRFWRRLGDEVTARGGETIRVNLNAGDALFWGRGDVINYRGSLENWTGWVRELMAERGVTDVLYYADQTPYHRAARAVAEELGVSAWTMEFGYLRPDWLTFERGGMGAYSDWPREPETIRELAANAPEPDMITRYPIRFVEEAACDMAYNLAMVAGRPFYPRYVADRPQHPVADYLSWARELTLTAAKAPRTRRFAQRLARGDGAPFHLVAMQLQSDYQVRASTNYDHLGDMLAEIATSFAAHAPPDHRLVVKLHPLDNGSENWPRRLRRIAAKTGLTGRLEVIKGGDLGAILDQAKSVVLANSTVGLHALQKGVPVKALGAAIYDCPGLTHQGSLDDFWTAPEPVDEALAAALVRALAAHIQIKGSFYHRTGQRVAVDAVADRLFAREARDTVAPRRVALAAE